MPYFYVVMKVFVYILFSSSLGKYYCGITSDIEKRLSEHNSGKGNFTSKGVPWSTITVIECSNRSEAMILEKRIKSRGIKRYLSDNNIL